MITFHAFLWDIHQRILDPKTCRRRIKRDIKAMVALIIGSTSSPSFAA
jgi:hypothetical protein